MSPKPDQQADAAFHVDTSKFAQASCSATTAPSTFSSLFSGVHDWLMGGKETTTVKDGSAACTASSPLTLNSTSKNSEELGDTILN